jgi:hypothetical protein
MITEHALRDFCRRELETCYRLVEDSRVDDVRSAFLPMVIRGEIRQANVFGHE